MPLERFEKINDEVYVTNKDITTLTTNDLSELKIIASANHRNRVRICAHKSSTDLLHEMIIVLKREMYVPPHKHEGKSESFHIIEGSLKIILFDDDGKKLDTISMGDLNTGKRFYYRLSSPLFHTVIPQTEFVIFHEVTNGPFDRKETVYAKWAPSEDESKIVQSEYISLLSN